MHPFVHAFNAAIAPPWETRVGLRRVRSHVRGVQPSRRTPPRACARPRRRAAAARHPGRDVPARRPWCSTGRAASATRFRADDAAAVAVVERDYAAVARDDDCARAQSSNGSAPRVKGVTLKPEAEVEYLAPQQRRRPRRRRRRPPEPGPRRAGLRGDPCPVGHDQRPCRTCRVQRARTTQSASRSPTSPSDHEAERITFADTQVAATAGDHLAGVVGQRAPEAAATRPSRSTSSD